MNASDNTSESDNPCEDNVALKAQTIDALHRLAAGEPVGESPPESPPRQRPAREPAKIDLWARRIG